MKQFFERALHEVLRDIVSMLFLIGVAAMAIAIGVIPP